MARELLRIAARAHAEVEHALAQREIRERPTDRSFLKAARCAVLLRDGEAAVRALEDGLRRFPNSAPMHAGLADLLEQRWQRDLVAADGRAIVSHLRKAWRLDGADAGRPLRLAAFLARIGAVRAALHAVDDLLELHPEHPQGRELRESLAQLLNAQIEAGRLGANDPADEDVDALLKQIEELGRLAGDPGDATRVARESARLRAGLAGVRLRTGCEKAFLVEPRGDVHGEEGPLRTVALAGLAAALSRSAQRTVRRLEMGPLLTAEMETAGGTLLLRRAQRCLVGVLHDQPEADPAARAAIRDLATGRQQAVDPVVPHAARPAGERS
jgi:tetratricopeptide (TPR) repeat protein